MPGGEALCSRSAGQGDGSEEPAWLTDPRSLFSQCLLLPPSGHVGKMRK